MSNKERVLECIKARELSTEAARATLSNFNSGTEVDLRNDLQKALAEQPGFLSEGWYSPPPAGISILFANSNDVERSKYLSLREEQNWPSSRNSFDSETINLVHVSPVCGTSGMLGDLGFTTYQGQNQKVKDHINKVLNVIEDMCDYAEAGLQFGELYSRAVERIKQQSLATSMVSYHGRVDMSFGHTVPWSYEDPTEEEKSIIATGNINNIKELISKKRIYINSVDSYTIPQTCALTVEARLTDLRDQNLPNTYFHYIVTFINGEKKVLSGFNSIFATLGMDYVRSRF
jgi:hypothetical protein